MQKTEFKEKYTSDGGFAARFEGNRNVTRVVVSLKEGSRGGLLVKYAQNGIISDLVYFGEAEINGEASVEIKPDIPMSASHIYVFPGEGVEIGEFEVFELPDIESGNCYPAFHDLDLKENYYLDSVTVVTPPGGFSHYTVYTSLDGSDFSRLARKTDNSPCKEGGDRYDAKGVEARIIRVYIEYNSATMEAALSEVKFEGKKSNTPVVTAPPIEICDFEDSEYNVEITEEDTYEAVYGIIERRIGKKYRDWFSFSLTGENEKGYDYFLIENREGKIRISGNCGVSLATGLNHYLKYYCKVNISQVGDQVVMPREIVSVDGRVYRETKGKVRYSYNYCTLSYSMAFWGEKEWQDEMDWLALNGVNAVLDATAQEEVWRRFLSEFGYSHTEIKKYIAGPAYYAWAYMANLYGYGGPVHDSWFYERTALARKNHLFMRKMGMYPVLQGYSGMVPVDICDHDSEAEVIPQGRWCSFTRPYMLKTTSPCFKKYAKKFYEAQKSVYGDYSIYFATDPFHEGGNTADMSLREIAREVLSELLSAKKEGIWIIQSWQQNPTSELLMGLSDVENGRDHALILDLYAEKLPRHPLGAPGSYAYGYSDEYDKTPWIFCMLNNFGGRLGLHGHLDNLAKWIPEALNIRTRLSGIGITPEASINNPVLYDFFFESIWREDADAFAPEINLSAWLSHYAERRYGKATENSRKVWEILKETVYKAELNNIGQGAPESVLNARPSLRITAASTWGNAVISYNKADLEKAAGLLLSDYDSLKESDGYIYDLVTILQQVLSNRAQDYYNLMVSAFKGGKLKEFIEASEKFLKTGSLMERVLNTNPYYMLGRWVEQAKALSDNADDFSKQLYEFNAKALITTWGAYNQAEIGQLHDYSNRQWAGLISDFYMPRWERWIAARISELKGEEFEQKPDWFEWEWEWARDNKAFPTEPSGESLKVICEEIFA